MTFKHPLTHEKRYRPIDILDVVSGSPLRRVFIVHDWGDSGWFGRTVYNGMICKLRSGGNGRGPRSRLNGDPGTYMLTERLSIYEVVTYEHVDTPWPDDIVLLPVGADERAIPGFDTWSDE